MSRTAPVIAAQQRSAELAAQRAREGHDSDGARRASRADTPHLLRAAAALSEVMLSDTDEPEREDHIAGFINTYRSWIIEELDMADAPDAWAERTTILLHLMLGASTIGEAIKILVRFAEPVWGSRMRFELLDEGDNAALLFHDAFRPGAEGLVCALWPLRTTLSQLEFLAGGELHLSGRVRHEQCLPGNITNLLFGRAITYRALATTLILPKAEMDRAVVVRASDVPAFLRGFMRTTIGAGRGASDMHSLVSTLVWNDTLRGAASANMPEVARRLGMSVATARRRLHKEGTTFREIREEVLDQLAKMWLREPGRSIESIAEQLGYSDAFAFRRAFRKRNGAAPQTYRKGLG